MNPDVCFLLQRLLLHSEFQVFTPEIDQRAPRITLVLQLLHLTEVNSVNWLGEFSPKGLQNQTRTDLKSSTSSADNMYVIHASWTNMHA